MQVCLTQWEGECQPNPTPPPHPRHPRKIFGVRPRPRETGTVTLGRMQSVIASPLADSSAVPSHPLLCRNVDPALYNTIQKAVISSSRHGIGAIFAEECQHGVQGDWHTIFPSPYTLAATFDVDLLQRMGQVIGTEARAGGTSECWSPVCGLAREPRWGRTEEEMSEDPFLAGELASSMVRGMVGAVNASSGNLSLPDTVAPLLKHFAAYSVPEAGRNAAPSHMGVRELQTVFLPVFAKAVRAGAQGAMSRYNTLLPLWWTFLSCSVFQGGS